MQATSVERLQNSPTPWRTTHVEIPLRVVAHQLNVPTYLVLRLASRLGFFLAETSQGRGNYLSKDIQKEGVFFSPQQCAAMQDAILQLKAGQSWQDLNTFEERTPPKAQVKVTPLYVKALQGKAWLPQYERPPLTNAKEVVSKSVEPTLPKPPPPLKHLKPFQRLNHTQAIWTNPPEGKHPFLR